MFWFRNKTKMFDLRILGWRPDIRQTNTYKRLSLAQRPQHQTCQFEMSVILSSKECLLNSPRQCNYVYQEQLPVHAHSLKLFGGVGVMLTST